MITETCLMNMCSTSRLVILSRYISFFTSRYMENASVEDATYLAVLTLKKGLVLHLQSLMTVVLNLNSFVC